MREATTRWVARHIEGGYPCRFGLSFRVNRDNAVEQLVNWFNSDARENKGRQIVMAKSTNKSHPDYPEHRVIELGLDDNSVLQFIESEVLST